MKVICKNCHKSFDKEARNTRRSPNHFCTRSCAASFNNNKFPKRKSNRSNVCPNCKGKKDFKAFQCRACKNLQAFENNMNKPIKDLFINSASKVKYASIRFLARKYLDMQNIAKCCSVCGFDHIVEVCHIKPIKSFSDDAKLSEVNSLKNIKYLCPNHHSMLDRGMISL